MLLAEIRAGEWVVLVYERGFSVFYRDGAEWLYYSTFLYAAVVNVVASVSLLLVRRAGRVRMLRDLRHLTIGMAALGVVEGLISLNSFGFVSAIVIAAACLYALVAFGLSFIVLDLFVRVAGMPGDSMNTDGSKLGA